jgi:hypothetical protein
MCHHALPTLQREPSDHILGSQCFQSIQFHEGKLSVRYTIEALGDDTLMFETDSAGRFPKSVDALLGWSSLPNAPNASSVGQCVKLLPSLCAHAVAE